MISVQLWSLREEVRRRGWDAVLDDVADAGFTNVEPYVVSHTGPLIRDALRHRGLAVPSAHGDLREPDLARTLDAAAELGAELVAHPGFPGEQWARAGGVEEIEQTLRTAAEAAATHGMRVAFHHHDDELRTLVDGSPALLVLLERLRGSVGVQFDPNWTTIAGLDVLDTLAALGPAVVGFHVKDGPLHGRNEDQQPLGRGELAWPAFLAAADPRTPRVISLDEHRGDTLAGVVDCLRWLQRNDPAHDLQELQP